MFYRYTLVLLLGCCSAQAQQQAITKEQVKEWILTADSFRSPIQNGEFSTSLTLFKNSQEVEQSNYFVQLNEHGDSRVTMLDKRSKGQKVLLTEDAMWLYIPRTKKAIRITPMQRLMGQASYGDVSSLNWQHEYQWNEAAIEEQKIDEMTHLCLTLDAIRKSSTYRSIYICLDKQSLRPINAKFFLASGKLMKQAEYIYSTPDKKFVSQTIFTQSSNSNQYTVMENINFVEKGFHNSIFTRQGFIKR